MPRDRGDQEGARRLRRQGVAIAGRLDAFLTGAGARTEHYEIAAYEGLVTMAEAMGEDKVANLLSENLEQEKNALTKMQTIGKRLAQDGAAAVAVA